MPDHWDASVEILFKKFRQLQKEELKYVRNGLMEKQPQITRKGRAAAIEKLFEYTDGAESMKLVFTATSLFDLFYS